MYVVFVFLTVPTVYSHILQGDIVTKLQGHAEFRGMVELSLIISIGKLQIPAGND